jgi:hypothetical protein
MGIFRSPAGSSAASSDALLRFADIMGDYSTILVPAIGLLLLPTAGLPDQAENDEIQGPNLRPTV